MPNIFEIAARNKFRYRAPNGQLTTEQLFDLPLTSTTGKANLNDVAVAISDEVDKLGTKSFVASASTDPQRTMLNLQLDVVKAIIETKQAENAAARSRIEKRAERDKLLDAIEQADRRELGSKSADELRKQLAALDD